jgi:lipopolysaccharide biosynthesis protein
MTQAPPAVPAQPSADTQAIQRTPRLIAFYLPQFHPIPENDKWWGKGFTEWTNVTKAQPLFTGHYQPHLPTDFGFYDLRVRATKHDQVRVAKQYGIDGFCFHYYWFSGKRILEQPVDDILNDPDFDFPFCLNWANENWTRRWDAADHEVLMHQRYRPEDDVGFIQSVEPFLRDRRYIRVNGKPLLMVYNVRHMPNPTQSVQVWRDYCRQVGLGEIHLCAALTHNNYDFAQFGFDTGVEFPPHKLNMVPLQNTNLNFHDVYVGTSLQFADVAKIYLERQYQDGCVFKTVFPSWDNTSRTGGRAVLMLNGTPENYQHWLASTLDLVQQQNDSDPLIFINAWNEWAEGCHLEPDRRYGRAFLDATLAAKQGQRQFQDFPHQALPNAEHWENARRFWHDLAFVLRYHALIRLGNLRLAINRLPWLRNLLLPVVRTIRKLLARQ